MSQSSRVPGLWVKLQGAGTPGNVLASVISFSGNDLRTANAIQAEPVPLDGRVQANTAGIQANQQQIQAKRQVIRTNRQNVEENRQSLQHFNQRFSDLSDYDVKSTSFVYFAVSSVLTPQARNELLRITNEARRSKTIWLTWLGYTDFSAPAPLNQDLRMRRAQFVNCTPGRDWRSPFDPRANRRAMDETRLAAVNCSPQGRAENRRAETEF